MEKLTKKISFEAAAGEEEKDIKLKEIKDLKQPLENILNQLRDNIDRHLYDSILGDDTSGRIPTLILSRTINNVYKTKRQEAAPNFFVAAGGAPRQPQDYPNYEEYLRRKEIYEKRLEAIEKQIEKDKRKFGERVLVITDFIESGETILNLAEILKRQNIKFDIASVAVPLRFSEESLPADCRLFSGKKGGVISAFFPVLLKPKIYAKPRLSGLARSLILTEKDVFAKPYKFTDKNDREKFLQARKDSYLLADKLTEDYFQK